MTYLQTHLKLLLTVVLGGFLSLSSYAQTDRYVNANVSGGANDGSSWTDAFDDLQAALNVALSGDRIFVAGGTYKPSARYNVSTGSSFGVTDPRAASFQIRTLEVYGGLAGTETSTDLNATNLAITLANRDLVANASILSGDIGALNDNTDNAYHVVFTRNNDPIVDGFTITGGNANGGSGATLYNNYGAGWYNKNAGATSNPTIRNCIFTQNIANPSGGRGGAIYNNADLNGNVCSPDIVNCSFIQNSAEIGGAIYTSAQNGGITNPRIINSVFSRNTVMFGAGMYNQAIGNNATCNPEITNCSFSLNAASNNGGGVYNNAVNGTCNPQFVNSTFWGNTGSSGTVTHSIFNANAGTGSVSYCLVEEASVPTNTTNNGNNLFAQNPLFVDAANDDLRLQASSPALDAGDNTSVPTGVTTDLAGNIRIQNTTVDMGAYEGAGVTTTDYYVDANVSGGTNNGSSWTNAFSDLQDALGVAASGDRIFVAGGTYKPSIQYNFNNGNVITTDSRAASFRIPDGVEVYGGFAGNELPSSLTSANLATTLANRNLSTNNSTLSGDIDNTAGNAGNAYHVVYTRRVSASTVVDGFTITDGNANGGFTPQTNSGGGWYNDGSGTGNSSSPTLRNLTFSQNTALQSGGGMYNGGRNGDASPRINDCVFNQNTATFGGGIHDDGNGGTNIMRVTNCSFTQNSVTSGDGGAIWTDGSFSGNTNPIFINCAFSRNSSTGRNGGAMYNLGTDNGSNTVTIRNCSFSQNRADNGDGGAMYNREVASGNVLIQVGNSIFWDNSDNLGSVSSWDNDGTNTSVNIANTLIQEANTVASPIPTNTTTSSGGNLFGQDPFFVDAANDDLRLQASSPALDAGNNTLITSTGITTDLAGNARIQNTTVDMGAYERVSSVTLPTVTTATQTNVTATSATLGGNVTASGGTPVTSRGIVWATTANPTTSNNQVAMGSSTGTFSQTVTGLPAGTLVYVRAFAINSQGTAYGSQISFTTSAAAPEIDILGGTPLISIADGSNLTNVGTANGTEFGNVALGNTVTRTYTIRNTGSATLNITSIISSGNTAFGPTGTIPTTVAAGGTETFTVEFNPVIAGTVSATIRVQNNDANEAPYDFIVQGTGTGTTAPEIDIQVSGTSIPDNTTTYTANINDFGNVAVGSSRTITFTIDNTAGTATLNVSSIGQSGAIGSDLTYVGPPPSGISPPLTVAAGATTTFGYTFTPSTLGTLSGSITIQSNDADEGTYNFSIQGTGVTATPTPTPTPTVQRPASPTGFSATAVSSSQINLSWNRVGNNVTGYVLYQNGVRIATLPVGTTSFEVTGLDPDSNYRFSIEAVNGNAGQQRVSPRVSARAWTLPALPTLLSSSKLTICQSGQAEVALESTSYNFRVYGDSTSNTVLLENGNGRFLLPSVSATTTFYIATVGRGGEEGGRTAVEVVVEPAFEISILGEANRQTCESALLLEALEVENADSYEWLLNGNIIPNQNGTNLTATRSGNYEVRISKGACTLISDEVNVRLLRTPVAAIAPLRAEIFCEQAVLSAEQAISSASYVWTSNGQTVGEESSVSVSVSGTYVLTVTQEGCQASDTVSVQITNRPEAPQIAFSDDIVCPDGEFNLSVLEPNQNLTYEWFRNGRATGQTGTAITTGLQGNYSVRATLSSLSGCATTSEQVSLSFASVETFYLRVSEDKTGLFVEELDGSQENIASVEWLFDGEADASLGNDARITPSQDGYYSAIITNQSGCQIRTTRTVYFRVPEPIITGEDDQKEETFVVYPNPTSDELNIRFGKSLTADTEIVVFDATGRKVKLQTAQRGSSTAKLDLSRLSKGVYTVQLISQDGVRSISVVVE